MGYWTFFFIGTLVTWRVTRFIVADDLVKGTRQKVLTFLDQPRDSRAKDFWSQKAWDLLTCPWCVGIYVSAGYLLLSRWLVVDSIPVPIWTWLAIAAAQIIPYQFCDGDWIVTIGKKEH